MSVTLKPSAAVPPQQSTLQVLLSIIIGAPSATNTSSADRQITVSQTNSRKHVQASSQLSSSQQRNENRS
ncbi:unnamed protein product [Rotaria magnacalcarata]|uniref:Uncharacterized protein n=1 Tax=Rotaria magnacalcarata TaxID=392030 RepID=A0A819Z510_9BILA|nr:unnamed protein product [Rotaria magnacalcarata]CAF3902090.1 unnamed protein product [Rotaria magnacalcarata]CAF3906540.1 unnamed protein product [Rotaria magnacalcarata]CAF3917598.1 unnamed protein product [Rotaria magnacalcarata]CAF3922786.1 unnamed protein product [Rotaria magnacalcarata]